ncbi:MAG: beta-propeller domain-containing protein, partial [Firmicutes bacterium]|nr:beta-propeller domain-containing protein [Bacillota bacterium]
TVFLKLNLNNLSSKISAHLNANIFDLYVSKFAIYPIYNFRETIKNNFSFTCFYSDQLNNRSSVILKLDFDLNYKYEIKNSNYTIYSRYALFDNGENFFYAASDLQVWNNAIFAYDNSGNLKSKKEFGEGEKIYSVNYDNNKCFAVTFRQTDPLFEFDISNPNDIKLTGELEIPDYSTYLYPYSENLLIGLGVSSDPRGIKIDLYKVGIGGNPIREYSFIITGVGINDVPALTDPRAILIGPDYFGFALMRYVGGYYYQEFLIFEIEYSEMAGEYSFSLISILSNFEDGKITENNWNQNFEKVITRAVVINDYLYTISDGYITSYEKGSEGFELIEQIYTK